LALLNLSFKDANARRDGRWLVGTVLREPRWFYLLP
jgi:hypothetical protein